MLWLLFVQVLEEVCKVANVLTYHGVRKGDTGEHCARMHASSLLLIAA